MIHKILKRIKKNKIIKSIGKVGKGFSFCPDTTTILRPKNLNIGDDVYLNEYCHLSCWDVTIGNKVMIGPYFLLESDDHKIDELGKYKKDVCDIRNIAPVVIEDDVWIGGRVTVLKGVTIGMGAVVGAGSLVLKSIPPFTVSVGNPCKPIKKLFTDEELKKHLKTLKFSENSIREIINRRNEMLKKSLT